MYVSGAIWHTYVSMSDNVPASLNIMTCNTDRAQDNSGAGTQTRYIVGVHVRKAPAS